MSARAEILQTIRKALGRSEGQPPEPLPDVRLRPIPSDRSGLVERFVQSLEKLNGKTFVVPDAASVIPAISGVSTRSKRPFIAAIRPGRERKLCGSATYRLLSARAADSSRRNRFGSASRKP